MTHGKMEDLLPFVFCRYANGMSQEVFRIIRYNYAIE